MGGRGATPNKPMGGIKERTMPQDRESGAKAVQGKKLRFGVASTLLTNVSKPSVLT
jgi:hypothetical protein